MTLQVTTIMLAVQDMELSKKFYVELGAKLGQDYPHFASFELTGGSGLGIYPVESAAADAGVSPEGSGFRGVSFHHIVDTTEQVDDTIAAAVAAGGAIVKPAAAARWGGYFGYIADPDGYLWKIASAA
ncbi:VOC family protein [Nocardia sp. NPDC088792]|uniref:VOC family protein n=1 Tax=Nocardia sp. NPDC088792 TaxID=3364332 RepID=UPI00380A4825